jgi:hypothetical protein
LARKLEQLPAVRAAVADGKLGYTKAREIVTVATAETEQRWLAAAARPRRELVRELKRARRAAKLDPGQGELLPAVRPIAAPRALPVRFALELTPEQEARRGALVERLHKLGGVPHDRAELLLEALAALVDVKESEAVADKRLSAAVASGAQSTPRGVIPPQRVLRPPVQIHVHEDAATGRMTVSTAAGERALGRADAARMRCDAVVCGADGRNRATVAPRVRREVLTRDRYRCRVPGCGRTRCLEVHHVVPRWRGGTNRTDNLMTLCGACHRVWHERGRGAVALTLAEITTDGRVGSGAGVGAEATTGNAAETAAMCATDGTLRSR